VSDLARLDDSTYFESSYQVTRHCHTLALGKVVKTRIALFFIGQNQSTGSNEAEPLTKILVLPASAAVVYQATGLRKHWRRIFRLHLRSPFR
jgi:hypothetical protein